MTVSEYSKNEILGNYRLKNKDIVVAGNGWQHFNIDMWMKAYLTDMHQG